MGSLKGGRISNTGPCSSARSAKSAGRLPSRTCGLSSSLRSGTVGIFLDRAECRSNGPARLWETASAMDRPIKIHLADELDAFLCLVIELEHEAEDVARIDEADNNDISRVRDLVVEDHVADARFDRLDSSAFLGAVEQFRMSGGGSERPVVAGVVFQDLQVNQAVESRVNNRLRTGSKPFDPVLGVSLNRFAYDFLQNWVQCRVARFRPAHKVQCFRIRVDSRHERKLREDGADDGAVQVPAGYLVEVAALFVEERQDEFFGQT